MIGKIVTCRVFLRKPKPLDSKVLNIRVKSSDLTLIQVLIMNLKREYEQDFHQWIEHHITLLKQGRFNEIDAEHLIEELEDMGKSNLHE